MIKLALLQSLTNSQVSYLADVCLFMLMCSTNKSREERQLAH
jgi:hypothetical protein